jgi:hypothetical protein
LALTPASLAAQQPQATPPSDPITTVFRTRNAALQRNLAQAFDSIPESKFGFKPTPAQMSFAQIQVHLANEGNDVLCGKVAGVQAPQRAAVDTTMSKEQLVARLKETFQFCESAFARLDDSKLAEPIQLFGPNPYSRATAILITVGDWADHYSQEANYLRLNGVLPPTAQRRNP